MMWDKWQGSEMDAEVPRAAAVFSPPAAVLTRTGISPQ